MSWWTLPGRGEPSRSRSQSPEPIVPLRNYYNLNDFFCESCMTWKAAHLGETGYESCGLLSVCFDCCMTRTRETMAVNRHSGCFCHVFPIAFISLIRRVRQRVPRTYRYFMQQTIIPCLQQTGRTEDDLCLYTRPRFIDQNDIGPFFASATAAFTAIRTFAKKEDIPGDVLLIVAGFLAGRSGEALALQILRDLAS